MKNLLLIASPFLLLAGCSRPAENIRPGQWEMEVEIASIDAPDLPEQAKQQMRSMMKTDKRTQCFRTSSQNPLQEMRDAMVQGFSGKAGPGSGCTFADDDKIGGGVIKVDATCRPGARPVDARLTMNGGFTEDSMNADFQWAIEGPTPQGGQMTIKVNGAMRGRRLGDC
jgi:hypothetical protein